MKEFDNHTIVGISTNKGPQDFITKYEFVKKSGATPLLLPAAKNKASLELYINECRPNFLWLNDELIDLTIDLTSNKNFTFKVPSTLFFSSGSTSTPKVIVHSDENLHLSAQESLEEQSVEKAIPIITSLPLWHVGGMLCYYRSVFLKSELVLTKGHNLLSNIIKHKDSLIVLVPSQLDDLIEKIKAQGLPYSSFSKNIFYLGGASINKQLIDKFQHGKLNVIGSYGMTETAGAIALGVTKLKLFKNVSVKIDSRNCLLIKSKRSASHYIINNKMVPIDLSDGFIETSDIAEIYDDHLTIKGRIDHVFLSGGENISPTQLENLICKIDNSIKKAKVIPKENTRLGNEIIVFISPYNDHLVNSISTLLPHTQRPHKVFPWPKYNGIKPSLSDFHKEMNKQSIKKILFLHGFMGIKSEVQFLEPFKSKYVITSLDIPDGNQDSLEEFYNEIDSINPDIIYGYSLGGRLALNYLKSRNKKCELLILESVSFGIEGPKDRMERVNLDETNAMAIKEDFKKFLTHWYSLKLWGSLTKDKRLKLIEKRYSYWKTNTEKLSKMVVNYSPGKMPYIKRDEISSEILYIYGEQDIKYKDMAHSLNNCKLIEIENTGHNTHEFNERSLIKKLQKYL